MGQRPWRAWEGPVGQFAQIARDHDLSGNVADLLDRFAQLEPEIVRALGGDRFPQHIHLVAGRQ